MRRLFLTLLLISAACQLAIAATPGVTMTFTPTGGTLTHNYTTLSGGTSPGGIGYGYGVDSVFPSWNRKTSSTYFSTPVFSPTTIVAISAPYYSGYYTDSTSGGGTVTQFYALQGTTSNTNGSSVVLDTGSTGSGNTGLAANTSYTFNIFITNYCTNTTWTVTADDGSFLPISGTFNEPMFQTGYATANVQFATAGVNSGATFKLVSNGAACDAANAFFGIQGYTFTTGVQANPDGTPAPTPTPTATPTPVVTPTPSASGSPGAATPIPGGAAYNGSLNGYAKQPTQVPLIVNGQPGQTADLIDVIPQPTVTKQVYIDANGILHANGGTSLLAYNSSGQLIGTPHIVFVSVTTPGTSQNGCGPYYPTGSFYCATITLPTGPAQFSSAATWTVGGDGFTNGNGVYYSPLGGTLYSANWQDNVTLYVGSSAPNQTSLLQLFGY